MPTNIPLGTYVSDGVRTGPLYTGQVPSSLVPFNPNLSLSYSSYSEYGPGIQLSTQATYNITPNLPNIVGQFTSLNNLVAPVTPGGAGPLTLRGDNSVTKVISDPSGMYVQFDWPRVPTVTVTGTTAGNRKITLLGYDIYGNPLQHTYTVNAIGTYPSVVTGVNAGLSIPAKAFYQITQAYIDGAVTGGSTISLGASDIFGLPFLVQDAGDITGISWGSQSDLSSNVGILSSPIIGTSTLVAAGGGSTVDINCGALTSNSVIQATYHTLAGTSGTLSVPTREPTIDFSIKSSSATDTSTVDWTLINPNGSYPSGGTTALVGGSATIYDSHIQSNDIVQLSVEGVEGGVHGLWTVAITSGKSFTVNSTQGAETSDFFYSITPSDFPSGTSNPMVSGIVFVPTPFVGANSVIILTYNTPGGTTGVLSVPSAQIQPGVGFTIKSSSIMDTSTVNWTIERLTPGTSMGTATLVGGTVVINTTAALAGSTALVGYNTFGTTPPANSSALTGAIDSGGGALNIFSVLNNGDPQTTDTSTIYWAIFPPGYARSQFSTPLGVFVPGDQTFPPSATTGDVRGLYAPSSPSDGVSVLKFTSYIAGADTEINQVSNEQTVALNNNPPQPVVGVIIDPLTPADLYGTPQYFTGTPA
jgi:hypothetical protein